MNKTTPLQKVSYQLYSKHRKPFLTAYYPFLTPSQINSKLRQEWASLNFSKATKPSRSRSQILSKSCPDNQTSLSPLLSENIDGTDVPDPLLALQLWDQRTFDADDDDDDDDFDSVYQRNKSRIHELNRSSFTSSITQRRESHHLQNRARSVKDSGSESAIARGCNFDEDDESGFPRVNKKSKVKDYSKNAFRLDYPVPAVQFEGKRHDSNMERTPSILKNSRSKMLKWDSDLPRSRVRFSHLTPEHSQRSKLLSNLSPSNSLSHDKVKAKRETFSNQHHLLKRQSQQIENPADVVSNFSDGYDFNDDMEDSFKYCSYSAFKKESGLDANDIKIREVSGASLPKSKSTSFLLNTISACSRMLRKSRLSSPQGRKTKSVNENQVKGLSTFSQSPSTAKSKPWERSPSSSKQSFFSQKPMSYCNHNSMDADTSLNSGNKSSALAGIDNHNSEPSSTSNSPTNKTKGPCPKQLSFSKKRIPSTSSIARQLQSASNRLSAVKRKVLSPKTKFKEMSKHHLSSSKKSSSFPRCLSDSNIQDMFASKVDIDENAKEKFKRTCKSLTPKNKTRKGLKGQDLSTVGNYPTNLISRLQPGLSLSSKYPGPYKTAQTSPSLEKNVSFYEGHSDRENNFNCCSDDLRVRGAGTVFKWKGPKNELKELIASKTNTPQMTGIPLLNEATTSNTKLLRSAGRYLSPNKSFNPSTAGISKLTYPEKTSKMSKFYSESDNEDAASFYSDDENASLIVRHNNGLEMGDDYEGENGFAFQKLNNMDEHIEYEHIAKPTYDEQSSAVANDTSYDREYEEMFDDSYCSGISRSRFQTSNKTNVHSNSFQWDGDVMEEFVEEDCATEIQCKGKMNQHQVNENQNLKKSVKNQRHERSIGQKCNQISRSPHRQLIVKNHEINNSSDGDNMVQSSDNHVMESDSLKSDSCDGDSDNYSESNSDDEFGELSGKCTDDRSISDDYDDDNGDDDNASFASKAVCQTSGVLNKALRRTPCKQYTPSNIAYTACSNSNVQGILRIRSNSNHDNRRVDDNSVSNVDDDTNVMTAHANNNANNPRSSHQGVGDFTLTDLFDDVPYNSSRPQVDHLGMARRMFESSSIETSSKFGSLFDEEDIFV